MNQAERTVIASLITSGLRLRNINLQSEPLATSPLDLVIDRELQERWLSAEPKSEDLWITLERLNLAKRRSLSLSRSNELQCHPHYEEALTAVIDYVVNVIPCPEETEGRQWTVTLLPKTSRRSWHRRLVTVNIQNLEVLYIGQDRNPAGECVGFRSSTPQSSLWCLPMWRRWRSATTGTVGDA